MFKIFILQITALAFIFGCGQENAQNSELSRYYSRDPLIYDYYEIANGTIVYTGINVDYYNISRLYPLYGNDDVSENNFFQNDYNMTNVPLNIDEKFDAYKTNILNLRTNSSISKLYKKDYGLIEIKTNYCVLNPNLQKCETYVYTRKN